MAPKRPVGKADEFMTTHLLGSTLVCVLALLPIVGLGGVALVGDMIGDWGRGGLLAYAAVLLSFIAGIGAAGEGPTAGHLAGTAGVVVATTALFLGGSTGLTVVALGYGILLAVALFRSSSDMPWPLLAVAAAICLGVAARYKFR